MSDTIARLASRIEAKLAPEMDRLKGVAVKQLSVPVERVGGKTIRSKPGEFARLDTGALVASASSQTIDATLTVEGSVSLEARYIRKLLGIRRKIFGSLLSDNKPAILDAIRAGISNRS